MTILVTGGCGFIGSNFIRHLLTHEPHCQLINLDLLTYAGNALNLVDIESRAGYRFVHGDICDAALIRELFAMQEIDVVYHLAAESHVDRSIHDATPFVRTNVFGTQVLLDACLEFKVKRFIHVSTDEVYGSLGSEGAFSETSPLAPNSPYAASKAAADLLVRSYVKTYDFPALITRCSNNYGPYQFPEKLIPLFITNLLADQPVPIYGDGQNIRDWIHVEDHCAALRRVGTAGRLGEIYNIGGGNELTNLELTERLLTTIGKPHSLIRFVPDRPGHDRRYAVDSSKLRAELGWKPQVEFDGGLAATVRWYQEQQAWLQQVKSGTYRDYYRRQYGNLV